MRQGAQVREFAITGWCFHRTWYTASDSSAAPGGTAYSYLERSSKVQSYSSIKRRGPQTGCADTRAVPVERGPWSPRGRFVFFLVGGMLENRSERSRSGVWPRTHIEVSYCIATVLGSNNLKSMSIGNKTRNADVLMRQLAGIESLFLLSAVTVDIRPPVRLLNGILM